MQSNKFDNEDDGWVICEAYTPKDGSSPFYAQCTCGDEDYCVLHNDDDLSFEEVF